MEAKATRGRPMNDPKRPTERGRLFDVPAAAAYLDVSPRFIRRLIAERRLAFVKLGRHVRFDIDDLDAFIDSGRVLPVEARGVRALDLRSRSA